MMKVKIDIDSMTFVRFLMILAGFVLAGYLIYRLATPLIIIFMSFFLAIALTPPVNKLASLIPGHSRLWATAISYIIILSLLTGLMVVLIPPAIKQSVTFIQQVPSYIDTLQDSQGPINGFLRQYGLEGQLQGAVDNAKDQANVLAQRVGTTFVSGVGSILNGLVVVLTMFVLTFLMLIEGPRWMQRIWYIYNDDHRRKRHQVLAEKMYRVITAYVNGQLLVAFIAAATSLLMLLLLTILFDVPFGVVLPLAAIVFVTSMIPMIGATLGGGIVTVALLFNDVTAALIFLGYFIVYQQIENNLVQPVVQSKSVDLSALSVIIAVILGIYLAGIVGGLVAIPIAGCLRIILKDQLEQHRHRTESHSGGVIGKVKHAIVGSDSDSKE